MALPRRTAWATVDDFERVFGLLFASNGDIAAQRLALNQIRVWQSRGTCPYAAETTASLLQVILRDAEAAQVLATSEPSTSYAPRSIPFPISNELRLAYAMALTRFVNSLVDPAQQSSFARSISSIAVQIGLPLWFVELRHAATHEDLPSLRVCRDASRKAVDWLYHNYWLPQVQPAASFEDNEAEAAEEYTVRFSELKTILTAYKVLRKEIVRDASLEQARLKAVGDLERKIEKWALDFGSFSLSKAGLGSSDRSRNTLERRQNTAQSDNDDEFERLGVSALCSLLVQSGFLIPTSKKKRTQGKASQVIPTELLEIWRPLLSFLEDSFDAFSKCLLWEALDILANNDMKSGDSALPTNGLHKSYLATLTAWVLYLIQQSQDEPIDAHDVVRFCLLNINENTTIIAKAVSRSNSALSATVERLLLLQRSQPALIAPAPDATIEEAISTMQQQLDTLEARLSNKNRIVQDRMATSATDIGNAMNQGGESETKESGSSWQLVEENSWRPCPFGIVRGSIPRLTLQAPA